MPGIAGPLSPQARIVGLFRLGWAVGTHFANFDLVPDLDWEQAVIETLPAVEAASSMADYYAALQHLVAQLRDGHSFVLPPPAVQEHWALPAATVDLVEDQPAITWVAPVVRATGLAPGDMVMSVDGEPVDLRLAAAEDDLSASTDHARRALARHRLLAGPPEQPA